MRLLVYELNEVPWRILDDHVQAHPEGAFARLLSKGASYTTRTVDGGHLHPWVTWPTMHRGIPASSHGVQHIGQDPQTFRGEPLWTVARAAGRSIGIFGSLQSWPPGDPGTNGFYVPDCYAPTLACVPSAFESFQAFTKASAEGNARLVTRRFPVRHAALVAPRLVRLGLRPRTMAAAVSQLLGERRDARLRHRRSSYLPILGFDLFVRAWRRRRPDYAAFFTNHVAGMMHRYWRARYPEEYRDGLGGDDPYFASAIPWAMEQADAQLGELMSLVDADPETVLVVASSMGQAAVKPTLERRTLRMEDPQAFLRFTGYEGPVEIRAAMEPDHPFAFRSPADQLRFTEAVNALRDRDGKPVVVTAPAGLVVNVQVTATGNALLSGSIRGPNGLRPLAQAGLAVLEPETPGTAYHVPLGTMVLYGAAVRHDPGRTQVSVLDYAPTLLDLLGVAKPALMPGRSLANGFMVGPGRPRP
ncbi:MAG: alkaline phosphatase family protein [Thermoplasmatota archaeon]